jgi:tetratricopeptide (TPR) repeat protein
MTCSGIFSCTVALFGSIAVAANADSVCSLSSKAPLGAIEQACGQIIADPKSGPEAKALAFRRLGHERRVHNRHADAFADFTDGLALGGVSANMRSNLYRQRSETSRMMLDLPAAFRDAENALEADPNEPVAHHHMASLHRQTRDLNQQRAYLNSAIRLKSDYVVARLDRAIANMGANAYELMLEDTSAVMTMDKAILRTEETRDRQSRMIDAWTLVVSLHAYALANQSRATEAEAMIQALVREAPTALSYRVRAEFLTYLPIQNGKPGRDAEALADFMKVVESYPNDHMSWWEMSRLLLSSKRPDEALTAISIAIQGREWPFLEYEWQKARILRQLNRTDDAVTLLTETWKQAAATGGDDQIYDFAVRLARSGFLPGGMSQSLARLSPQIIAGVNGCMRDPSCN